MKSIKYTLLAAASLLALSACSDDLSGSDWKEGEQSAAPGIFFAPENDTFVTLLDGEGSTFTLKVKRIDTNGQLTVPVVVKEADPAMGVPSSITFADGCDETDLTIDCTNVPSVVTLPISLTFPDEYINPYAAGAATFDGSVIASHWVNVGGEGSLTECKIVSWSYTDTDYQPFMSEMLRLEGSQRYRIMNFLNTGINFTFDLVPSPLKEGYYRIVPVSNQLLLADYGWGDYAYYNSWWLISDTFGSENEEEEDWPSVELIRNDGGSYMIYFIQFLWYDDATKSEYCYVLNYDKGTPKAYMSFYGNGDEDMETYTPYMRLSFSWHETGNNGESSAR